MSLSRPRFRVLPFLVVAALFAVFALPALAEPPGPPPPPCEVGQIPSAEHPCKPPPCPEGTGPTREKPCLPSGPVTGAPGPGGTSPGPSGDKPKTDGPGSCGSGGSGGGPTGGPTGPTDRPSGDAVKSSEPGAPTGGSGGDCRPPSMDRGFMNRVWKFVGEVDSYDDGVLSITVGKILNLPKKFSDERSEIVDEDARVLVGSNVRVYDKDGKRTRASALEDAENVRVQGKMLATSKWTKDEDGQPVPTIRAKKVFIVG
jgi:hypothetical protein